MSDPTLGQQVNAAKRELNDQLLPLIQAWEKKYGLYIRDIDVLHAHTVGQSPAAVSLTIIPVTAGQL